MVLAEFRKLLAPEHIEQVVQAAARKARERRRERPEEADRMRAEIAELRREYENFMNAIGQGKAPAGVMARLTALEAQIATKEQLLEGLTTAEVVDLGDARLLLCEVLGLAADGGGQFGQGFFAHRTALSKHPQVLRTQTRG